MQDDDELLTTEAAARMAGMSIDWVRKQIQAGRLRATVWRINSRRAYRIHPSDWEAFSAQYSGDALDDQFLEESVADRPDTDDR